MSKLNYVLIALVLGALALGIFNAVGNGKVETVNEKTVEKVIVDSVPLEALKKQADGYGSKLNGLERKMEILEKGFSTIISSLQVILGKTQNLSQNLGGLVHSVQEIFSVGIKAGDLQREIIDSKGVLVDTIFGGGVFSTSTGAAGTTTVASLCDFNVFNVTPRLTAGATIYFPATTTLATDKDCMRSVGDSRQMLIYVATTTDTGDATTTFSAFNKTGIEIMVTQGATSTNSAVGTDTNADFELRNYESALMTIWKRSSATTTIFLQKLFRP